MLIGGSSLEGDRQPGLVPTYFCLRFRPTSPHKSSPDAPVVEQPPPGPPLNQICLQYVARFMDLDPLPQVLERPRQISHQGLQFFFRNACVSPPPKLLSVRQVWTIAGDEYFASRGDRPFGDRPFGDRPLRRDRLSVQVRTPLEEFLNFQSCVSYDFLSVS